MDKKELLQDLESKYSEVEAPEEQSVESGKTRHRVKVVDKDNIVLDETYIPFIVEDSTGYAYYVGREPKAPKDSTQTFRDKVEAYISDKISNSVIESADVKKIREEDKRGIIEAVLYVDGSLETQLFLVLPDGSGGITHKKIANSTTFSASEIVGYLKELVSVLSK